MTTINSIFLFRVVGTNEFSNSDGHVKFTEQPENYIKVSETKVGTKLVEVWQMVNKPKEIFNAEENKPA